MVTIFLNALGILLVSLLEHGKTIDKDYSQLSLIKSQKMSKISKIKKTRINFYASQTNIVIFGNVVWVVLLISVNLRYFFF